MTAISKRIVVLAGDGIGPEVTAAAVTLLQDCAAEFGHRFEMLDMPFGGSAIDRCGSPLPAETLVACRAADAILLGAVGGPKWDALPLGTRPESGLLGVRKELGLYINVRPIRVRAALLDVSPLKPQSRATWISKSYASLPVEFISRNITAKPTKQAISNATPLQKLNA